MDPIKNGDIPASYVSLPEGRTWGISGHFSGTHRPQPTVPWPRTCLRIRFEERGSWSKALEPQVDREPLKRCASLGRLRAVVFLKGGWLEMHIFVVFF